MASLLNQIPDFDNCEDAADRLERLEEFELEDQISTLRGFIDTIQEKLAELEEQEQQELGIEDE